MLRRLPPDQPASFAFTPANAAWAQAQIAKYPEGRQASAIIPLLWRAQEQEGWLTRPAIEAVADMLGLARIRALEVATFYFMFQLQPVGSVAHVQVCGTTSCMICGAEDLIGVCREKIAPKAHMLSADGKFSWEEVECLGACSNAPMAQIGKDYYEDLTAESFAGVLDVLARGEVPRPGSYKGRFASEPVTGLTSLVIPERERQAANGSVALALEKGDTVARITGDAPAARPKAAPEPVKPAPEPPKPAVETAAATKPVEAPVAAEPRPSGAGGGDVPAQAADAPRKPKGLAAPRRRKADDLKRIKGVGAKIETQLHALGVFHYDQIAGWTGAEVAWMDENLDGIKGRASRDDWVAQAKALAAGLSEG
jgi:NADH-quinone oxidoreductase subunit E